MLELDALLGDAGLSSLPADFERRLANAAAILFPALFAAAGGGCGGDCGGSDPVPTGVVNILVSNVRELLIMLCVASMTSKPIGMRVLIHSQFIFQRHWSQAGQVLLPLQALAQGR